MINFLVCLGILSADSTIQDVLKCKLLECCTRIQHCDHFINPVRIITGMDWNAPEWASITGMDIKINLFNATKFIYYFTIIYLEISVFNNIAPF